MQNWFHLAYSLGVALLFVLAVVMGARTFFDQPGDPVYPYYPMISKSLSCDFVLEQCASYLPDQQREERLSLQDARTRYPDEFRAVELEHQAQQEYEVALEEFHDDDVARSQAVLMLSSLLGVAAIAAGLYLFPRVDAMPLGLLLGGLGSVIYGAVESRDHYEEIGAAPVFATAAVGFVVLLAAGYWLLRPRRTEGGGQAPPSTPGR